MMPRPQFRLSTLLWITLAVTCWFGGMRVERWRIECERREWQRLETLDKFDDPNTYHHTDQFSPN
jgi:hypothetical protein